MTTNSSAGVAETAGAGHSLQYQCGLCSMQFHDSAEQRLHMKDPWQYVTR